ncbi:ribonuclease HII [Owenweeksia hongkongensis]|uniref:ribonuclease HII n=1 Tax=Owenweeksia hongkongensis TaxID=253245 RepID=UPI003A91563A
MPRLLNCHTKGLIEAGCDEAGRGCLAGPVTAAAVILPPNFRHKLLDDSKKMTEAHREELRFVIEEKALAWAVASVTHEEIDKINILNASFLAMHRAVEQLKTVPQALLIDGNRFNAYPNITHHCIIKGDGKFKNIAAASVLAKTHRDEYMAQLAEEFPQYGWKKNKGYPTTDHRAAIEKYGTTSYHRQSFRLLARQTKLGL